MPLRHCSQRQARKNHCGIVDYYFSLHRAAKATRRAFLSAGSLPCEFVWRDHGGLARRTVQCLTNFVIRSFGATHHFRRLRFVRWSNGVVCQIIWIATHSAFISLEILAMVPCVNGIPHFVTRQIAATYQGVNTRCASIR